MSRHGRTTSPSCTKPERSHAGVLSHTRQADVSPQGQSGEHVRSQDEPGSSLQVRHLRRSQGMPRGSHGPRWQAPRAPRSSPTPRRSPPAWAGLPEAFETASSPLRQEASSPGQQDVIRTPSGSPFHPNADQIHIREPEDVKAYKLVARSSNPCPADAGSFRLHQQRWRLFRLNSDQMAHRKEISAFNPQDLTSLIRRQATVPRKRRRRAWQSPTTHSNLQRPGFKPFFKRPDPGKGTALERIWKMTPDVQPTFIACEPSG